MGRRCTADTRAARAAPPAAGIDVHAVAGSEHTPPPDRQSSARKPACIADGTQCCSMHEITACSHRANPRSCRPHLGTLPARAGSACCAAPYRTALRDAGDVFTQGRPPAVSLAAGNDCVARRCGRTMGIEMRLLLTKYGRRAIQTQLGCQVLVGGGVHAPASVRRRPAGTAGAHSGACPWGPSAAASHCCCLLQQQQHVVSNLHPFPASPALGRGITCSTPPPKQAATIAAGPASTLAHAHATGPCTDLPACPGSAAAHGWPGTAAAPASPLQAC